MSEDLIKLSNAMADAVEQGGSSAVTVKARRRIPATGIALTEELILTASHVVEDEETIWVALPDGQELTAELLGRDLGSDLALLKLEKAAATPAQTNGQPRVGQMVMALGRPGEDGIQASLGIISAIGGPSHTGRGGVLEQHIRTDATPYPGFSGGPLVDAEGKVLAINTSGLGRGASLAIPIELAKQIADTLEKHGTIKRGYLGVRTQPVGLPAKAKLGREQEHGLLVVGIEPDTPAANSDLMVGDIIVGFNSQPTADHEDLFIAMRGEVVGQPAPLEVLRGGQVENIEVTLTERPKSEGRRGRMRRRMGGMGFGPGMRRHRRGWGRHGGPRVRIEVERDDD